MSSRQALGAAAVATTVIALDVATKALAEDRLREPADLVLGAKLKLSYNTGVAFGGLSGLPDGVVIAIGALALGLLILAVVRQWLPAAAVPVGLVAGGAVANLADRVTDGRVTDFIDLGAWPAFNIGDIGITAGALLLVLASARTGRGPHEAEAHA